MPSSLYVEGLAARCPLRIVSSKAPAMVGELYRFADTREMESTDLVTRKWLPQNCHVAGSVLLHLLAAREEGRARGVANPRAQPRGRVTITGTVPVVRGGYNPLRSILFVMDPVRNLPPDILDPLKEIEQGPPDGVNPIQMLKNCRAIGFCEYLAKADQAQSWQWRRGMTYLDLGSPEQLAQLDQIIREVPVEGIHSSMFLHLFHRQGDSFTRHEPITGIGFLPQISYYSRVLNLAFHLPSGQKHVSEGGCITSTSFQLYGYAFERMVLLARLAVLRARLARGPQPQERSDIEREIQIWQSPIHHLNQTLQALLREMQKEEHCFERGLFKAYGNPRDVLDNNLGDKPFRVELRPAA